MPKVFFYDDDDHDDHDHDDHDHDHDHDDHDDDDDLASPAENKNEVEFFPICLDARPLPSHITLRSNHHRQHY